MKLEGIYGNWAFAGNPIIVTDDTECRSRGAGKVYVTFHNDVDTQYVGAALWPLRLNISEIVKAYTPPILEPTADYAEAIGYLEDVSELTDTRSVTVTAVTPDGDKLPDVYFCALPGGLSAREVRAYRKANTDPFVARFLNPLQNFFLTTRSSGRLITIPENEISPLYYVGPDCSIVKLVSIPANHEIEVGDVEENGIFALNINAARRLFMEQANEIPAVFDVIMDSTRVARICVVAAEPAVESYRLKFRNSLGVYDIVALNGQMQSSSKPAGEDDETFLAYDSITDTYVRGRDRQTFSEKMRIPVIVNNNSRMALMHELLASEEVWLLDTPQGDVRVIPSCEEVDCGMRITAPLSLTISLTTADDIKVAPIYSATSGTRPQRIFTDEFSQEFE